MDNHSFKVILEDCREHGVGKLCVAKEHSNNFFLQGITSDGGELSFFKDFKGGKEVETLCVELNKHLAGKPTIITLASGLLTFEDGSTLQCPQEIINHLRGREKLDKLTK